MTSVWQVFQECGWASWLCVLVGLLALLLSGIALGVALARARAAVLLAWLALSCAFLPIGIGAAGMVLNRVKVNEVVDGPALDPSQRERIRVEGYRQAAGCLDVGGTITGLPLLLALSALSAAYALRRQA